jgi:hypothetical protein
VETTDVTIQILRDIRDEIRGTNARLDRLETRVEDGFAAVDGRLAAVDGRLAAVEGHLVNVDASITSMHRDLARLRPIGDALVKQRLDNPRR